jgi:type II secretory pathway pseudopilin PulG
LEESVKQNINKNFFRCELRRLLQIRAFTLVEVLVSAVIIVSVAASAGVGITALFQSSERSSRRSQAVSLLQKSQEEVFRAAQIFFDILETCYFSCGASTVCGFDDTCDQTQFPGYDGFTRELSVTTESGAELKRSLVTVRWTDVQGQDQSVSSVMLIPRASDPLPGNIIGTVSSDDPTQGLLSGVTVRVVQQQGAGTVAQVTSQGSLNAMSANFDISSGGAFFLPVGTYMLTASGAGHLPYTHPSLITVDSASEIFDHSYLS